MMSLLVGPATCVALHHEAQAMLNGEIHHVGVLSPARQHGWL